MRSPTAIFMGQHKVPHADQHSSTASSHKGTRLARGSWTLGFHLGVDVMTVSEDFDSRVSVTL